MQRGGDEVHYWFGVIPEHHEQAGDGRDGWCASLLSGRPQRDPGASIYMKREGQVFALVNICQPVSQRNLEEACTHWGDSFTHEESVAELTLWYFQDNLLYCGNWNSMGIELQRTPYKNIYIFRCYWIKSYSFFWCYCLLHAFCLLSVTIGPKLFCQVRT